MRAVQLNISGNYFFKAQLSGVFPVTAAFPFWLNSEDLAAFCLFQGILLEMKGLVMG
jgi:hypothetical protein